MSDCASRHKNYSCSLSATAPHDIHVKVDEHGVVKARWRVVTEAIPNREVPDDD